MIPTKTRNTIRVSLLLTDDELFIYQSITPGFFS